MDDSRKISERLWNRPEKGELERWERITCLPKASYDYLNRFTLKL